MEFVSAHKLSNLRMVAGNESTYTHVIDDGYVKEWVGFGWIILRKALSEDKEKYPTVRRS